jgi:hypothetical protein
LGDQVEGSGAQRTADELSETKCRLKPPAA